MSAVETGQMSAVDTGQMSAAETVQMSAVETRQIFKHFLEMPKITYGQLGRHYFWHFREMRQKNDRKQFRKAAQKKVLESAGLFGAGRAVL